MNREGKRYWFDALPEHGAMYLYFQSFADLLEESFADFQDRMFRVMDQQKLDRLIVDLRWNAGGNGALIWPLIYNIIRPWSERELHDIGRNLRRAGHLQAAIAAYSLNTDAHPDSWNAWDHLGGAWHKAGSLERARSAYEKSVALNPGNANGVSRLEEIARALAARPR